MGVNFQNTLIRVGFNRQRQPQTSRVYVHRNVYKSIFWVQGNGHFHQNSITGMLWALYFVYKIIHTTSLCEKVAILDMKIRKRSCTKVTS